MLCSVPLHSTYVIFGIIFLPPLSKDRSNSFPDQLRDGTIRIKYLRGLDAEEASTALMNSGAASADPDAFRQSPLYQWFYPSQMHVASGIKTHY